MIALEINDVGNFMKKFLVGSEFDRFYLAEGEVATMATFRIDGTLNASYFTDDEREKNGVRRLSLWSEIRPFAYQLMKGKKLPVSFKFVLQLSDDGTSRLLEENHLENVKDEISGLYLNIRYQERKLVCVTGLSYKTFVMDKTLDRVWDDAARQFLNQNEIAAETK